MKYLFFDIECSNCFNGIGKMCEFGYVLTNEEFEVIRSGDIPMSPGKGRGSRFNLKGRKYEKDLELAYDESYYLEQQEFPHFYKQIKAMVEDPDTICFAYSMDNDITHLHNTCIRYRLKPYNYICYDVQKFVSEYKQQKEQISLHKACISIVGPNSTMKLIEHLSRDDAEMEKLVFEAICMLTQKSSKQILEESQFAKTNSLEFMKSIEEETKRKRERNKGRIFYNSIAIPNSELNNPEYKGRKYNISGSVKVEFDLLKTLIKIIKNKNGVLCNLISESDYYIVYDDKQRQEILSNFKYPFEGKIITYKEFIDETK